MFQASEILYLYVESPLHAGSGGSIGVVDLPIQRERVTGYPIVQASGLKGKLRAEAYESDAFTTKRDGLTTTLLAQLGKDKDWAQKDEKDRRREAERRARKQAARELGYEVVFGPESDEADLHAGAISPGDARLLLFPVRSLVGVFAWTTSLNVLARFQRDLEAAGKKGKVTWDLTRLDRTSTWTVDDQSLVTGSRVVLEEFSFKATAHEQVGKIATWLAGECFATQDYFTEKLKNSLIILPEDAFRDFTQLSTEVVTRIRLDQETKTVAQGALWTEEYLPADTLLYAPVHATRPRTSNGPTKVRTAADVLTCVRDLKLDRIQLGGDETVGRGIVRLHLTEGE